MIILVLILLLTKVHLHAPPLLLECHGPDFYFDFEVCVEKTGPTSWICENSGRSTVGEYETMDEPGVEFTVQSGTLFQGIWNEMSHVVQILKTSSIIAFNFLNMHVIINSTTILISADGYVTPIFFFLSSNLI